MRDELRLRNGTVIQGQSVAHDGNTVVFRGSDGIKPVAAGLILAAILNPILSSWRAASIDPMQVLRIE